MCEVDVKIVKKSRRAEKREAEAARRKMMDDIVNLVSSMNMLSRCQIMEYFQERMEQDRLGQLLAALSKKRTLTAIEDEEGQDTYYIADKKLIDPAFFRTPKGTGQSWTFRNASKFMNHKEYLSDCARAFWIFLDFKRRYNAEDPQTVQIKNYPFVLILFSCRGQELEIWHIKKGREIDLGMIRAREQYEKPDGATQRIILIDDEKQIPVIREYGIKNIWSFVTVDEYGETRYRKSA